jgi:hypothetical protein
MKGKKAIAKQKHIWRVKEESFKIHIRIKNHSDRELVSNGGEGVNLIKVWYTQTKVSRQNSLGLAIYT